MLNELTLTGRPSHARNAEPDVMKKLKYLKNPRTPMFAHKLAINQARRFFGFCSRAIILPTV